VRVHDETATSLTLSIFNNDGTPHRPGPPSSGKILVVDQQNHTVTHRRTLLDADDEIYANTQGSLQLLGNSTASSHVLLDYGSWATVKEFNGAGDPVLTVRFGPSKAIQSYRGYKAEWHATPWWNPDVVVRQRQGPVASKNMTTLYMSWNGATDYDTWAVYARQSLLDGSDIRLLALKTRTGFETNVTVPETSEPYLQAVPIQGGKTLGYSTIVELTPIE
jgi:hypothetical protein